ncbi:hypothetical protein AB0L25_20640 [Spirillospora sp. NPDC052242]
MEKCEDEAEALRSKRTPPHEAAFARMEAALNRGPAAHGWPHELLGRNGGSGQVSGRRAIANAVFTP